MSSIAPFQRKPFTDQEAQPSRQIKVLVVDDTATNRQILQVFLNKLGYSVLTANDGAQAVERFTAEIPDLILMDVMMPVMDGYEATRRIKALSGERWVPVVFLSALDTEESLVAGLDAGGDDYLAKPVNFVILDAKLRDELIGHNLSRLMPEPYRSEHDDYLRRYVESGVPHILGMGGRLVPGVRADGQEFPVELGVTEMWVSGRRQFVGVVRDVTERMRSEAMLKDNAERLQRYHDMQEAENEMAQDIVRRQMMRSGLSDPRVHHWVSPAANFSGDIVAANRAADGTLYVLLADATGHGLGAAICTLPVLAVFYSLSDTGATLPRIVGEVNRQLAATMPIGRFVAASMLRIDYAGLAAEIWIGGMPDLLLIDQTGAMKESIAATHLPLGIAEFHPDDATPTRIAIESGDQFVLYSDGLPEAEGTDGEPFGLGRLRTALAAAPPANRLAAVQDALLRHVGAGTPHDDVSLLVIDCG